MTANVGHPTSVDAALEVLAGLALEDGRRWGDAAADWQWEDARAVLDTGSAPMHFLTRPRGGSKTSDLGGICLSVLTTQAPAAARCYAVAADQDQAGLLLEAIAGFVRRTPGLAGAVEVQRWKVVARHSGASLTVLAADSSGTYGLLPYFVVVDELAQWKTTPEPRRVWEAIYSAMPKVAGARLVVLTSAGDPAHWSAKVLAHAQAHARWRVHEVAGPVPWLDAEALAEQQALLTASAYARLHLNRWTAPEDRLTTPDDARACVGHVGVLSAVAGVRYVVGVDVGVRNDATVAAVCHAERGAEATTVVLDRLQVWEPGRWRPVSLGDVEAWLLEAHRSYASPTVVVDPWQALAMAQRLRGRGVEVVEFTFSQASVGRIALSLYRLLRDRLLDLPDDEALVDELAAVRLRETSPGVYRMDHDPDRHDDRAVALALAAYHLLEAPPLAAVFSAADIARAFVDVGA